jgi:S-adenosylmethionine decarboxylase
VNVYQENIFHTKMMLKDFNLNSYLFGITEADLQAQEKKTVVQRMQREINEIYNGTNIPK